jgi:hypothetical protein
MCCNVNVKIKESQGSYLEHGDYATLSQEALFVSSHIPVFFFLGPDTAFRKFENASFMLENAVSDAYG